MHGNRYRRQQVFGTSWNLGCWEGLKNYICDLSNIVKVCKGEYVTAEGLVDCSRIHSTPSDPWISSKDCRPPCSDDSICCAPSEDDPDDAACFSTENCMNIGG